MMVGCSTGNPAPPIAGRGSPTPTEPLACSEFPPLRFQPGKPEVSVQDVLAALAEASDPLGYARGTLGDTRSTRLALSDYTARRKALGCVDP
jgi:hypothetical protein